MPRIKVASKPSKRSGRSISSVFGWMCGKTATILLTGCFCMIAALQSVFIVSYIGRSNSLPKTEIVGGLPSSLPSPLPSPVAAETTTFIKPSEVPSMTDFEAHVSPSAAPGVDPDAVDVPVSSRVLVDAVHIGSAPAFETFRATNPLEVDTSTLESFVSTGGRLPIAVIAANRASMLRQTLTSLLSSRGVTADDILIIQDGAADDVKQAAASFGVRMYQSVKPGGLRGAKNVDGAIRIAQHYGESLRIALTIAAPEAPGVIIVEDDFAVSPDFYEYFHAVAAGVERCPEVWLASAWHDNGFAHTLGPGDEVGLWRTRHFPGLGWLLPRKVYESELTNWPHEHWDHWMRHPDRHRGRDVLVPRVPRDYHIGVHGTFMDKTHHYRYFRTTALHASVAFRWFGNAQAEKSILAATSPDFTDDLRRILMGGVILTSVAEVDSAASAEPVHVTPTDVGAATRRLFPGSEGAPWIVWTKALPAQDNEDFRAVGGYFGLWHEPLRGDREGIHAVRWGKHGKGVLLLANAAGHPRGGIDRRRNDMLPPFATPQDAKNVIHARSFAKHRVEAEDWVLKGRPGVPPLDLQHGIPHTGPESYRPGLVQTLPGDTKTMAPPPSITGHGAKLFRASDGNRPGDNRAPGDGTVGPYVQCFLDDPEVETPFLKGEILLAWEEGSKALVAPAWSVGDHLPLPLSSDPSNSQSPSKHPLVFNDLIQKLEPSTWSVSASPIVPTAKHTYSALRPRSDTPMKKPAPEKPKGDFEPNRVITAPTMGPYLSSKVVAIASSTAGLSCDQVCAQGAPPVGEGLTCVAHLIGQLNDCGWLKNAYAPCDSCILSAGSDQPAYIDAKAPADKTPNQCLVSSDHDILSCSGTFQYAHRLCPCSKWA